uniref:Capsid protein n=1 Tax=Pygoscelis antarcticus TaxID=79643 RepID=A0A7G7LKQ6_PYGAN|nr:capsid protein [Pygoscelis antarcticus]
MKSHGISQRKREQVLNKTEKKQTKTIVENAIKKEHTLKYFNSDDTFTALGPNTSTVGSALKQVSVLGYSSTTAKNNQGVTQKYGSQNIFPLLLAKPFARIPDDAVSTTNAPNGNTLLPKIARTAFSIERVRYAVGVDTNNTPDAAAARALPITIRVIKVGFKTQVGTAEELNPNIDLFLDYRTGIQTGIDSSNFDRLQCRYGKINTKKYTKLSDTMFTVNQNNILVPVHMPPTAANRTTDFFTKSGSAIKHMVVPFQLSQRKNAKLYYDDVGSASEPDTFTSGGQRQLLLIHSWYENGHDLLGATGQPVAPTTEDLQIKHLCQSAFVDTM